MRILFLLRHPLYLRNYESVIDGLCERGHELHLAFSPLGRDFDLTLLRTLQQRHPGILVEPLVPREGWWWPVGDLSRWVLDYLRYQGPEYVDSRALVQRVRRRTPPQARRLFERHRLLRRPWARAAAAAACRRTEQLLPPDRGCLTMLRRVAPDLVMATPMVDFTRGQTDFVKAARSLGIPTLLAVASWDNLTNKGLIQVAPHRTLVWNDIQKREAVQMHGLPPDSVVVTGAQLFDQWFERRPSSDREAFCARAGGLDPARPILLYLCSSSFICPDEVGFVRRWLAALRASEDPRLAGANVLVRPHPANAGQWRRVELGEAAGAGPVSIWPRAETAPLDEERKRDFFDSLHFSAAAVGVNTSALIEAGIAGCRSFTLATGDFAETQEGTLHFRYLVDGGLVSVAHSFGEHLEQLAGALAPSEAERGRTRAFVHRFVRPHGLDRPATPIFLDAVEQALAAPPAPWRPPLLAPLARAALWPAAALLRRRALHNVNPDSRRGVEWLEVRRFALPKGTADGHSTNKLADYRKRSMRRLAGIAGSHKSVIVGPWMSEVGFELLYWIPLLCWAQRAFDLEPERLVVVSRGGVRHWYGELAGRYLDLFDLFTPEEFVEMNRERRQGAALQKQTRYAAPEKLVLKEVAKRFGLGSTELLHPRVMYSGLLRLHWSQRSSLGHLLEHTRYEPLPAPEPGPIEAALPEDFYAVRFYSRDSFPDSRDNRAFVRRTLERLLERSSVVLLDSPFAVDDHGNIDWMREREEGGRNGHHLVQAGQWMRPSNNLGVQTRIVARSRGFVGTYGGLSYLAPFLGKPSLCFHDGHGLVNDAHVHTARTVFDGFGVLFVLMTPREAELLKPVI